MAAKTNKREMYVFDPYTVVPSANHTTDLDVGPGVYMIGFAIDSNVTGVTTKVELVPLSVDEGEGAGWAFNIASASASPTASGITLPAGAAVRVGQLTGIYGSGVTLTFPHILVPNKVRVKITKGTASTGELLKVRFVMVRVG